MLDEPRETRAEIIEDVERAAERIRSDGTTTELRDDEETRERYLGV
ncbi:hypothetical protein SAMN04487950_2188 [Halogranum rubrum]|uniref:Uncharacterized protein n=1 Tax=Halogranum rubrum TaxID=553466 RepID=A0A1I4ELB4_9EURY|nr:hypothetical protein [Halogranum rubrum]SFL05246.1 hypothetical protein SAMN04487950_2188 [Halogranum rubrum]